MPLKHLVAMAAAAAGLLLAGCASSTALPPPKSSTSLVLKPSNRDALATIPLHGELRIFLPAPEGGAGLVWVVVSNNTRVLRETSDLKPLANRTAEQAFSVTFQSVNPGRSTIRLAAVKPGESEQEPDDLYQVAVGVK